jgi:hypothetical protein
MTETDVMQVRNEDSETVVEQLSMTEEELTNYKRDFVRPFHLATGPLCRFAIISTPEAVCLLTDFHHLAFD